MLGGVAGVAALVALAPAVPEPELVRRLTDGREFFGVANFLNVASNAPLLLVGLWGARLVGGARAGEGMFADALEKRAYTCLFVAVGLAGVGSTYFHLAPDPDRLMWDRLPIGLGFMALVSAVIAERVDPRAGWLTLAPLLVAGLASVLHWRLSLARGAENILAYAVVQYGALLAMVVLALCFRSRYTRGGDLFVAVGIYALAKVVEVLDAEIYALGHIVSGHTLKHLLAAVAVGWLVRMLALRRASPPSSARPTR